MSHQPPSPEATVTFFEALQHLPDPRDNRGKRHTLAFVVVGVTLAILSGRAKVSSIFRYSRNRLEWLRELLHQPHARAVSRAHLPRLLARLDWQELNTLIEQHFGVQLAVHANQEWVAIDGKVLRGTQTSGEPQSLVLAVSHQQRTLLAQAPMKGRKVSEITVVRDLLKQTDLQRHKITLDAHHCNPKTTAQIHQAGGAYLIQVKDNQPLLLQHCQALATTAVARGCYEECDKGHGRLTTRAGYSFSMRTGDLAPRWAESGVCTLVTVTRHTHTPATGKSSSETAYYISNHALTEETSGQTRALTDAIRQHWHVESDNWIRDVTFDEDQVKTQSPTQGQVLGCLRSLAMRLLRHFKVRNFQDALETFADCPDHFEALLRRVKFL